MTWEIVLGIIALVGFIGSIVAVAVKWSNIITALKATLTALNETLANLQQDSRDIHNRMQIQIDDHEKRIVVLETKEDFALNQCNK